VNTPTHSNTRGTTPTSAGILVSDAMHHGVLTCRRGASLADVAKLMGIVSDLDLAAASSVRDLDEQTAGGTAATAALTVRPAETIQRAAQLMTEHATAHLVVVDEERRPLGIISTLDVAAVLGER